MTRPARAVGACLLAGALLVGCGSGGSGGDAEGPDDGCAGQRDGQRVQQGVDGSLADGTKLRVSYLTTEGGQDGAYVRWAPGSGGEPTADPDEVRIGDQFDLGGSSYTLTAVCDDSAWVEPA